MDSRVARYERLSLSEKLSIATVHWRVYHTHDAGSPVVVAEYWCYYAFNEFTLHGELTIKKVTHPVALDVEFEGLANSPWGKEVIGFAATTEIDREAWGMTWNQALETGGVMVGKKIKIEIEAEAVRS